MFVLHVDDDIELRLHDTYDVEALFDLIYRNRKFISQWMDWPRTHKTVDDTYRYIMWEREQFADRKQFTTQIYYQGTLAGSCALMVHDWHAGMGEIGYWLGEEFTGKGIATRAAKGLLNFAFNTLNLHKITIMAIVHNDASIAVAKRLGFTFEGIRVKQRYLRGKYYDYNVQYMLQENWTGTDSPDFEFQIDEHISLRPLMMHHADTFHKLVDINRLTLRQWVGWVDSHTSLDDTQGYIEDALERWGQYDGLDTGIWYDGELCGQVRFNSWSLRNYKGDLGYWLIKPFQGKGIMTEAVRAMLSYAFEIVGLHRIELLCALENDKSCAVAERLNFTHEGVMRRGERIRNKYFDVNVYAILKHEFHT